MIRLNLLASRPPALRQTAPLIRTREAALGVILLVLASAILFFRAPLAPGPPASERPAPDPRPPTPSPAAPESRPATPVEPPPLPRIFEIAGIELRSEADALVVALRIDPRAKYHVSAMDKPPRLLFDFSGTHLAIPAAQVVQQVDGPRVRRVRAGQPEPDRSRVVLDLRSPCLYKINPGTDGIEIRVPHAP